LITRSGTRLGAASGAIDTLEHGNDIEHIIVTAQSTEPPSVAARTCRIDPAIWGGLQPVDAGTIWGTRAAPTTSAGCELAVLPFGCGLSYLSTSCNPRRSTPRRGARTRRRLLPTRSDRRRDGGPRCSAWCPPRTGCSTTAQGRRVPLRGSE
jgi:hypothetical protein